MGIASGFLLQLCTRVRYGENDGMYGRTAGATLVNIPCRFSQKQKTLKLPDGVLWISAANLMVEDVDIIAGDAITTDTGQRYTVKLVEETRGLSGDVEIKTAWLE